MADMMVIEQVAMIYLKCLINKRQKSLSKISNSNLALTNLAQKWIWTTKINN